MRRIILSACGLVLAAPSAALAEAPLAYLSGAGPKADATAPLTWGLMIISIAVIVIISGLVLVGSIARRARTASPQIEPIERSGDGLKWIYIGLAITGVVLVGSLVWTMTTLAAINGPSRPAKLTLEVTGNQWWWGVRYLNDDPSQVFSTANEIHIPTGEPVRIKLYGGDVIHSFWVPALSGKTDTIPGQANQTWIEARTPGVYHGQCSEFCGAQHAHMAFDVVAQSPADFERWRVAQVLPAADPIAPEAVRGMQAFVYHCGACHAVRGSEAGGTVAPDLTHLMSRRAIAAGTLANNPDNLSGWLADPQAIKPGTHMPNLNLSGPDLTDIRSYLVTLR